MTEMIGYILTIILLIFLAITYTYIHKLHKKIEKLQTDIQQEIELKNTALENAALVEKNSAFMAEKNADNMKIAESMIAYNCELQEIIKELQANIQREIELKNTALKRAAHIEKEAELVADRKENTKQAEETILNSILAHPEHYYYVKRSCMNKNESRMYYYINCALDELYPDNRLRNKYIVFPQVSLHAFFQIKSDINKDYFLYNLVRRNWVAKNVDYIICNISYEDNYYYYKPLIMIELDGSSHYSSIFGPKELERQKDSDAFKDSLSAAFHIPLIRYRIDNTDRVVKDDRNKIKERIYAELADKETNQ